MGKKSILLEIQDTVIRYAEIMSKISGVDVEVVDENLFRVAGTGMFSDGVNEDMSEEGYSYRHVLKTGRPQIVYDPGEAAMCQECPKKGNCSEEIEISMPIRIGTRMIGVIGLVGSSMGQKQMILADEKMYMELIGQITDFIATKAVEVEAAEKREILIRVLERIMDRLEQSILVLASDGRVRMANSTAKKQLRCDALSGAMIRIEETGDSIGDQNEYRLKVENKTYRVMGQSYSLGEDEGYSRLLIFDETKGFHNKMYELTATLNVDEMLGKSRQTQELKKEIAKIAESSSTVLITGESGTGKELVATSIWRASNRSDKRFIAINCAAIPESLLESELFGYVKGAFTGADPGGRVGKFELANYGVIFLDEIGDMPLYLQAKLLRVLQERRIVRIGSNQIIPIDVRVIAATNKDLKAMIRDKKFREDLYYRLNVIPLKIAPLRERREDIEELTRFFAQRYAGRFGKRLTGIDAETMDLLKNHAWEGNVRELENTIEFMVNMIGEDGILNRATLPRDFLREAFAYSNTLPEKKRKDTTEQMLELCSLKEIENRAIRAALAYYGDDTKGKREAAKSLGIGLATLYRKLEEKI